MFTFSWKATSFGNNDCPPEVAKAEFVIAVDAHCETAVQASHYPPAVTISLF